MAGRVPNSPGAHQSFRAQRHGPGQSMSRHTCALIGDLTCPSRGCRCVAAGFPSKNDFINQGYNASRQLAATILARNKDSGHFNITETIT
jgi:hypothetical protein